MNDSDGTSGAPPGRPALSRLVTSVGPGRFATEYWGRKPLLSAASGPGFAGLFSADAVDELIAERGLRTPFLRVASNGSTVSERLFTAPGGVGAMIGDQVSDDELTRLFIDGATLVLQGLHRTWRPVLDFAQQLAAELGHPAQVNAYVTPPQSQGFSAHYDTHDVFVVQISGEKQWRVHEPVLTAPLRSQQWNDRAEEVSVAVRDEPAVQTTLRPGDCLYLPRGYLHAATALGTSIHLTIGVHPWTRRDLAEHLTSALLARLDEDPSLRASLPLGVDLRDPASLREPLAATVTALREALASLEIAGPGGEGAGAGRTDTAGESGSAAATLLTRAERAQRPEPLAPLRQQVAVANLTGTTRLRLRRHLLARLVRGPGGVELVSRVRSVPVTDAETSRVEGLLAGADPTTAAELGEELADRLLRAAILVPVD